MSVSGVMGGRLRPAAWVTTAVVLLSACGGSLAERTEDPATAEAASPPSDESPTPAPSPTSTLIEGSEVPLHEVAAIEEAVRAYFHGLADGRYQAARRASTGVASDVASWYQGMSDEALFAVPEPKAVSFGDLEVASVEEQTATVSIAAELHESVFDPRSVETELVETDISGTISLMRKGDRWLVADFEREGRAVTEQVRRASGRQESSGVVLEALAFDVRRKGALLVMRLRNQAGLEVVAQRARIIPSSGPELLTSFPTNHAIFVLPEGGSRSTTVGFFFPKGHTVKGKEFRFAVDLLVGCDPVCSATPTLELPVRLR